MTSIQKISVDLGNCKGCGAAIKSAVPGEVGLPKMLEQDQATMCAHCGHMMVFDEQLGLLSMTEMQMKWLERFQPESWRLMQEHQKQIRMRA